MPNADPWDGFFYPTLTRMMDSYSMNRYPAIGTNWHVHPTTTIRIHHECEGRIEKSDWRITDWHYKSTSNACACLLKLTFFGAIYWSFDYPFSEKMNISPCPCKKAFTWSCKINRIHHWCSVGTEKSQPEGPPFQWETRLAEFPTEQWTRGLGFF